MPRPRQKDTGAYVLEGRRRGVNTGLHFAFWGGGIVVGEPASASFLKSSLSRSDMLFDEGPSPFASCMPVFRQCLDSLRHSSASFIAVVPWEYVEYLSSYLSHALTSLPRLHLNISLDEEAQASCYDNEMTFSQVLTGKMSLEQHSSL